MKFDVQFKSSKGSEFKRSMKRGSVKGSSSNHPNIFERMVKYIQISYYSLKLIETIMHLITHWPLN